MKTPDPRPPHHHGRKFRNAAGPAGRGLRHYLRWAASRKRNRWPRFAVGHVSESQVSESFPGCAAAATFIGHSTFLIQIAGTNLLTDPVYSERVGPFNLGGPRRARPPGLPFEKLPPIHGVLLSHNHYDHADLATLRRLQRAFDPWIVTSLGNERFLRRKGFGKVTELDWWQSSRAGDALEITHTPAQHFSSRHPLDRDQTLWGGFVIASTSLRIYFVGDSGYGDHFKEIGRRTGPLDLALIPIGGYEPRWFMQPAHVNPSEAAQIHLDVRARQSIAMHFGTFQLADEGIDDPIHGLRDALRAKSIAESNFRVPAFGETTTIHSTRTGTAGPLTTSP